MDLSLNDLLDRVYYAHCISSTYSKGSKGKIKDESSTTINEEPSIIYLDSFIPIVHQCVVK